ncbi:unnamed protein product [Caenorhabditis bovis]|uniref:Uncharacterized protein n=1 Tax=Caenorhabditis bovis TaxID=2654633 RepID=A0A8S1ECQ3_9PELO|nr:unnamed protein product [Caenorhabditis bovis]
MSSILGDYDPPIQKKPKNDERNPSTSPQSLLCNQILPPNIFKSFMLTNSNHLKARVERVIMSMKQLARKHKHGQQLLEDANDVVQAYIDNVKQRRKGLDETNS